jgi:hypothetical protein
MSLKFFFFLLAILPLIAASVPVKPESVGLSEERLARIHETYSGIWKHGIFRER